MPTAAEPDVFEQLRPRLHGIAYGITGSVADAEDLCQEAWLRWQAVDAVAITAPEGFLVRLITNASVDRVRSAQVRREQYVGPYLPEPMLTPENDPSVAAERADELTFAFLVMLDALSPVERVVVLLHDVFGYSFDEVGKAVDRSSASCRQIASRCRARLRDGGLPTRRRSSEDERALVDRLIVGTLSGDIETLMALLSDDIVQIDDGGERQRAARHPIVGRDRVARFMINLAKRLEAGMGVEHTRVNGCPGLIYTKAGVPWLVFILEFDDDGLLHRAYAQLNPDKLAHIRLAAP